MRLKLLVVFAAALLVAADDKPNEEVKKDLAKLQGTWETVSLNYNGKDFPTEGKGRFRFVFKGDKATVTGNKAIQKEYAKISFKLDPSTMPRIVDLTVSDGSQLNAVMEGIYEIKGDEMRLCVKVFGKDRPLEFASPEGASIALLVMKRIETPPETKEESKTKEEKKKMK
jgi:uncharacterized protein (TIGR03067 family)